MHPLSVKLRQPGNRKWYFLIVLGLAISIIGSIARLTAGPVRGLVFDGVDVEAHDTEVTFRVHFNFPIQYAWHFPKSPGKEVLIDLRPVPYGNAPSDLLERDETAVLPPEARILVREIYWDTSQSPTRYLVVRFQQPTPYEVKQGRDWRSIDIVVARDPTALPQRDPDAPTAVESEVLPDSTRQ